MSDLVSGVGEGVVGVGDFGYFCGKMVFMKFRTEIAARREIGRASCRERV